MSRTKNHKKCQTESVFHNLKFSIFLKPFDRHI